MVDQFSYVLAMTVLSSGALVLAIVLVRLGPGPWKCG